ncbi:MAG: helix-turn-helix domain-containing protein, partial [Brevundimonas sp.]
MAVETGRAPDGTGTGEGGVLTLGDGLREGRERSGRSLAELSAQTRIPVRYLRALEQNDFSILPTRAFSIGYVRSYAAALGLDEQEVVERFRRESPDPSVPLQAPVGVAFEDVRRNSPRIIAGAVVVIIAVIGWNVFQRLSLDQGPQPSDIADVPGAWTKADDDAPFRLSLAQPA